MWAVGPSRHEKAAGVGSEIVNGDIMLLLVRGAFGVCSNATVITDMVQVEIYVDMMQLVM